MNYTEKLAYCASVIDCEGSTYISKSLKKNKKYAWRAGIGISMNDRHSLELFQSIFGGNIRIGHKKIDVNTKKEYVPAYVLSFTSAADVSNILISLLPYLQVKIEQANLLLNFLAKKEEYRLIHKNLHKGAKKKSYGGIFNNFYIKCKSLKKKNWIKI